MFIFSGNPLKADTESTDLQVIIKHVIFSLQFYRGEFHDNSCQNLYGNKIKLSQSPCLPTGQTNVKADGMNFYGKAFEYALAT